MLTNLHTHTFRCNHAYGKEREYIDNAIKAGIKVLGFSDHAPYVFEGDYYSDYRMRPELQEDYINTLLQLRGEYKDVIDIKIGYEAEYYPKFFDKFIDLIRPYPIDYLILGQHFIRNEIERIYSGGPTENEGYFTEYVDQVIEGISTGRYTYIAHPDLFRYTGDRRIYEKHYSKLIEAAKKYDVPLEINLLGIRTGRHYPDEGFFRLCGEIGAKVCMGSDAHDKYTVLDEPSREKAFSMIEQFGLNYIESPQLVKPVK